MIPRLMFFLVVLMSIASCGFHFRGQTHLAAPLKTMYLKTKDPYGELTRNIIQFLKMSGVHLTDTVKEADTVLEILSETTGQELLGVGSTQQTRQYNLTLTVTYQVTRPNGSILLLPEKATESRTLAINSNQILGSSNEANALYKQMRRAVVFDIMNRLSSQDVSNLVTKKWLPE